MADKDLQVTREGGGAGMGMLAGILLAAIAAFFLIYFLGGFAGERSKSLGVNVEVPNIDAPAGGGN
jgi:hypothetical protein